MNKCQDDYDYYLESFCFDKNYPKAISVAATMYLIFEIATACHYYKRIFWKIDKISRFDHTSPEEITYSRISLHILVLMRF